MAIVFRLPQRLFQCLALQIVVYWVIVAGHAASGYSMLVGIPLLPLLVIQIALLLHMWNSLVTQHRSLPEGFDITTATASTTPTTAIATTEIEEEELSSL